MSIGQNPTPFLVGSRDVQHSGFVIPASFAIGYFVIRHLV